MLWGQFGSGYAWLTINPDKQLEIVKTPNQNNPISNGYIPILNVDIWEHAYYLKYKKSEARLCNQLVLFNQLAGSV